MKRMIILLIVICFSFYSFGQVLYSISGKITLNSVGLEYVTIKCNTQLISHGNNGMYQFFVGNGANVTITPKLANYTFTPDSISLKNITTDIANQDFKGIINKYTISGVVTYAGEGISGVIISGNYYDNGTVIGAVDTVLTDVNGNYSIRVNYGSTKLTASKAGYSFSSKSFYNVTTNQLANFVSADWYTQATITGNSFYSVFFTDANTGYVVGSGGAIYKTTDGGINWKLQKTDNVLDLYSVFFSNANTGYTAGTQGTVLKTTDAGATWQGLSRQTSNALRSVYFIGNTGYAVGDKGTILKTTDGGDNWNVLISGSVENLLSVSFTDANTDFASGANGIILKTTDGGATWKNSISTSTNILNSIFFFDANTGYCVSSKGEIIKTTNGGSYWAKQTSGTTYPLFSVFFIDSKIGFAVGGIDVGYYSEPTTLKTTDGGVTWIKQTGSYDSQEFCSAFFVNEYMGYGVSGGTILKTVTSSKVVTYSVKGIVAYNGTGLSGVTIDYGTGSATTDVWGNYSITVNRGSSLKITPAKAGYTFSPVTLSVLNISADVNNQNFTASPVTYTVTGNITSNNTGLSGVTIKYGTDSVQTDNNGTYSISVIIGSNISITPVKTGYTFYPVGVLLNNITANVSGKDFTAIINTYKITGNVKLNGNGLADVTINFGTGTINTDAQGAYSITVNSGSNLTITPSKTGYTFSPVNIILTNITAVKSVPNFAATLVINSYTVTGSIKQNGLGLGDVIVNYGTGTTTTNAQGAYTITVNSGVNLTITPSKTGFIFLPVNIFLTNVTSNKTAQDFTATAVTGITNVPEKESLLYPNPTTNILYFSEKANEVNILIFDVSGKLVYNKQLTDNQIYVGNLQKGFYTIKIENMKEIITRKFVKK